MLDSVCPFFHPSHLNIIRSTPKGSAAWSDAMEGIRKDIFSCEGFLCTLGVSENEWNGSSGRLFLDRSRGHCELWFEHQSVRRRLIECPVEIRLLGYSELQPLYDHLSQISQAEPITDETVQQKSVLEKLKSTLGSTQNLLPTGAEAQMLVENLERLQQEQPDFKKSPRAYLDWIKKLASTLLSFAGFKTLFQSLLKSSPEFWASLSLRNKILVSGLVPAIGGGLVVGGIGLAGGGTALGVPTVVVVILVITLLGGISAFLEDLISLLRVRAAMRGPSSDELFSIGEELGQLIRKILFEAFSRPAPKAGQQRPNKSSPEVDFEYVAAEHVAKKYNGIPSVTQRSGDFGVDGVVVCKDTKEIILVQAKYYKNKVGFPDVTQSAGSFIYWQRRFGDSLGHPITKIVLVSKSDFSIEAQNAAQLLSFVELENLPDKFQN